MTWSGLTWSRRKVLKAGGTLAGVAAGFLVRPARSREVPAPAPSSEKSSRRVALLSIHTGERLDIEYFRDGTYVPEALSAIEVCLRDYRTGDRHAIDPALMDYLHEVARAAGVDPAFSVISGYRSPQTNAMLHERSAGVARHSLHMEGRAIDVRVTGIDCADLAARALDLKRGGVGYYRASDFVHLDTGAFRTWKG
jgi:uncharacterized protein YcbK (DUF882 family)